MHATFALEATEERERQEMERREWQETFDKKERAAFGCPGAGRQGVRRRRCRALSFLEVCTWTLALSTAARQRGWEVWEPISLEPGFDLLTQHGHKEAFEYVQHVRPSVLAFAWPCTWWSPLQNLNEDEGAFLQMLEKHRCMMLPFVHRLALFQQQCGHHFFGENPLASRALKEPPTQAILDWCHLVAVDMCVHGLCCPETGQLIKKPTAIITSSDVVARKLAEIGRCTCGPGEHRPVLGKVRVWSAAQQQMVPIKLSAYCGGYTAQFANLVVKGYESEMLAEAFPKGFERKRGEMDEQEALPTISSARRRQEILEEHARKK
jgi:hypothetical protein